MENNIPQLAHKTFESIRKIDEEGNEYWYARALSKILEYSGYRDFLKVIEKVKNACLLSNYSISDHFVEFNEMIHIGKGAQREIDNVMLSQYARYEQNKLMGESKELPQNNKNGGGDE